MSCSGPKKNVNGRRMRIISVGMMGLLVMTWINLSPRRVLFPETVMVTPPSPEQCNSCRPDELRAGIFYPRQFFEQGSGAPYLSQLLHNQNNVSSPYVLSTRVLLFDFSTECRVLHFHIHKNGGTTLEQHTPLPVKNFYGKREKSMGRSAFEKKCSAIMKRIYRSQQDPFDNCKFWSFALLRDPVSRFLSGLTQTLKLKARYQRLYPCYELDTSGDLVNCVLDMLEAGTFPDPHLAPQSFELYKQTMGYDIGIDVLDMVDSFSSVLQHLGAPNETKKKRSVTGSLLRRFPAKFRLTLDVLTPEMVSRICKIYEPDVLMLKQSGILNSRCP